MFGGGKKKVGVRLAVELVCLENVPSWCAGRFESVFCTDMLCCCRMMSNFFLFLRSVVVGWRRGSKKENSGESTPARYDPLTGTAVFSSSSESDVNE